MSLAGVRVLELAGRTQSSTAAPMAVAWAAKLFADLGADVIRIEPDSVSDSDSESSGSASTGDPVRDRPNLLHRWLHTNKRSVRSGLSALVSTADLVIHDGGLQNAEVQLDSSADGASDADQTPPVICSITPFGRVGPYAGFAAEELTVIHGSSWGFLSPGGATDPALPPLKAFGHHATFNVATVAATAALAAVERRRQLGVSERIDFSMFAAAAKMTEFAPAAVSYLEVDASRLGEKTVVPWGIFECADGLVQFICPEQKQWESLVELMGRPEWALMDVVATPQARRENADLVELYLGRWMAEQRVDELAVRAQEAHVCITPVSTMAQLGANEHFASRGFFATSPDGTRQPGPGYRFDQSWWSLDRAAPEPGQHEGEGWLPTKPVTLAANQAWATPAAANPARPLEGVRICDFTWIWAGPFCTQYLAHLGAEVIKLESPDHLCMFRRLPFNPPDSELTVDNSGSFHIYNSDKRSIGIDLGHPEAREVIRRLVAESDVVIDNFGVGTMAGLGYGVEDLRSMNPDVIVASLSGYGRSGPNSSYMAYGPAGGSLAGLYAATGYEGGSAVETGIAVGDPCTGITAAWAIVAALAARGRTGVPASIDVSMVEAVAATVGEPWMAYQTEGRDPERIANHDPLWAPHNCYPAAGEDRWVTIACTTDEQWQALASIVDPALARDPRFSTAELRKRNEVELDGIVGAWTAAHDRWDCTGELQALGIAAFPSLSPMDLWVDDAQLAALDMLERPDHPTTGARVVPGIPWRLAAGPNGIRRPAPLLGQDTVQIAQSLLGFTPAEVAAMVGDGVLHRSAD